MPMHNIKKKTGILCILVFFIFKIPLSAEKPMMGITGVEASNPRLANISGLLEMHLTNIIESTGVFSQASSVVLKTELTKYNCVEDNCIVRVARTIKFNLIIKGRVEDRGRTALIDLYCIGLGAPYYDRIIQRYKVEIPINTGGIAAREYSYICEEHAAAFAVRLLRNYKNILPLYKDGNGNVYVDSFIPVSGKYTIYRYTSGIQDDDKWIYSSVDSIRLKDNKGYSKSPEIRAGDFIMHSYTDKAKFLEELYYGRKEELVFQSPSITETLYTVLFSVPASITMPLMAPIGYYSYGDFQGLSLWTVNAAPYLYLELSGLLNPPSDYRSMHKNISKAEAARYGFGMYMLLIGGTPLFVDAFAHQYLNAASDYQGIQSLMGNKMTALYLSMVSGGGGHFYRGYRFWGYLYFHINNMLMYYTIREFSHEERYDAATDSYRKSGLNKKAAYLLLGSYCAVKLIEVVHVLLIKDNITSGSVVQDEYSYSIAPEFRIDNEKNLTIGVRCAYRF